MGLQGQCPTCFQIHSLDRAQLGSIIPCDCGTKLFVCDASAFAEIPIRCPQCEESYLAEPDDIGELVDCDCGAKFTVLDTVLQRPMLRDSYDESSQPSESSAPFELASSHTVREAGPSDSRGIELNSEPNAESESRTNSESNTKNRRSSSWLPIAGVLAVAMLFVAALVMFLTRDQRSGDTRVASASSASSQATRHNNLAGVSDAASARKIEPGALQAMLSRVPAPESLVDETGVRNVSVASSVSSQSQDAQSRSRFGGRTRPRKTVLPEATAARPRIPVVDVKKRFLVFDHAYQQAFESYEAFTAVEDEESAEYRTKLGETLSLVRHAYEMALQESDETRLSELTYLLAYLYHRAGSLIEASIFGEAAARWGKVDDPATKEALMIALAAAQEAAAIQWGDPAMVGELGQMWALAELMDERWPKDQQRDEIWMTLAQNYSVFNKTLKAAEAYQKIPKRSEFFGDAQFAAGSEYWNRFIDRASVESPDSDELVELLDSAYRHLELAVNLMAPGDATNSEQLITAKLTLAKIADRLGRPADVLQWIEGGPKPLTEQILSSVGSPGGRQSRNNEMARTVLSLLYHAKDQTGDTDGAQQAIQQLAALPDSGQHDELKRMFLSVAKSELTAILDKPEVTDADVQSLSGLFSSITKDPRETDSSIMIWLGESWATIAEKCVSVDVKGFCYAKAAGAYADAMAQDDFNAKLESAVVLRRAELLRRSGNLQDSLDSLSSLLEKNPNITDLQFEAAKTLQQISFQDATVSSLLRAIQGPTANSNDEVTSPIWGWERLVAFLHRLRYSPGGTEQHSTQLLEAQFHLARCRWILASAMADSPERDGLIAKTRMQVRQLIATIPLDEFSKTPWRKGLEKILAELDRHAG